MDIYRFRDDCVKMLYRNVKKQAFQLMFQIKEKQDNLSEYLLKVICECNRN